VTEEAELDYGLVAPLGLPPESKAPDPKTGLSTEEEYDRYFRIVRDDPGLLAWSRTCARIDGEVLEDLERTSLTPEDKVRILQGLLAVYRVTLERWVAAGEAALAGAEGEEAAR